jgi:quercetin dioxygenase-like cupin family protein
MSKGTFYNWNDLPQVTMGPGIKRRFVSGEKVMSVQFTFEKGAVVNMHQHPHEQLTHVLSGKLELTVGDETRIMASGDVLHIPANLPHSALALEDTLNLEVFSPPREDFLIDEIPDYMK